MHEIAQLLASRVPVPIQKTDYGLLLEDMQQPSQAFLLAKENQLKDYDLNEHVSSTTLLFTVSPFDIPFCGMRGLARCIMVNGDFTAELSSPRSAQESR